MVNSAGLKANVDVEYSDDPSTVLTEEEKEEICDYFNCRKHQFGTKPCPIEATEKKILRKI